MNLNNLKVSTRLALGFGAMQLLLLAIVGISYLRLEDSSRTVDQMVEYQRRAAVADAWTAKAQLNVARAVATAKAGGGSDLQGYFAPQIEQTSAEISALQKTLQDSISSDAGKALLAKVAEKRQAYLAARNTVFAQLKTEDQASVETTVTNAMLPAARAYTDSMAALRAHQQSIAEANVDGVRGSLTRSELVLGLLLLGSSGVGVVLAWSITVSVTRPLREAVASAKVMADSDLSRDIVSQRRDELGDLLRALAHMQGSLRGLVGQVRSATDSISTASAEIAVGNQDLSSRTEQTASNLQQTASSMGQLTGTVRQSADSARTANQLASSAASVAAHGGEVVSQVVSTMNEINASSKKIADIIGVIDGIAFQTNILALNAAVEAARAGEQGRGFAVVASEVRGLAQRSAEAAKEIKALIGASVDRVESGSKLVADAGSTMAEIVASVQRVSDIIGEISAASSEQSDGIGQVNSSVTQLDQMTQQNAALVEQSAAAAESLKGQAQRLAGLMATFRLGTSSPAPAVLPAIRAPLTAAAHADGAIGSSGPAQPAAVAAPLAIPVPVPVSTSAPAPRAAAAVPSAPAVVADAAPALAPQTASIAGATAADAGNAAVKSAAAKAAAPPATGSARQPAAGGRADGDWETF